MHSQNMWNWCPCQTRKLTLSLMPFSQNGFGMPLDLITDQGKEFCARLSDDLFKRLGTNHLTTSPHYPQCNSQAEVANKTIAKYLASFCDDSTLDWELYLAPLMFSYNTSFRRSIKTSPFFLTFGMEPRLPSLPTPDL